MEEHYESVLKKCSLFRNIKEHEIASLVQCLGAKVRPFPSDDYVFLSGEEINYVGIVLEGRVEIMKENLAGNKHIVAILGPFPYVCRRNSLYSEADCTGNGTGEGECKGSLYPI